MSSLVVDSQLRPTAARPFFSARFRWLAAAVLVLGPLFQAIEFLLAGDAGNNASRIAAWVANPELYGLSHAAGLLAVPFLIGGAVVLVVLTRDRSPRLALVAGALMTCAMVGLGAVHGVEMVAYGLARSGDLAAAKAVLDVSDPSVPFIVLVIMFFGGAVSGILTLAAATWRSPRVPRMASLFILAFAVLDFAIGLGVISHLALLAGFSIVAVGVVTGYSREPDASGYVLQ